uniref:Uncharacterized protein n=1 Tax=Anguilla anguilla TaxID=7936 RepID=A0A0E9PQ02_ANGAN
MQLKNRSSNQKVFCHL